MRNRQLFRYIKIMSVRRTKIFKRWLAINFDKPHTIILAILLPFLQAFLASVMVILSSPSNNNSGTNLALFGVAGLYYFSFAMNAKRATKGSWLGLVLLIIFGALGIVCGKLFTIAVLT